MLEKSHSRYAFEGVIGGGVHEVVDEEVLRGMVSQFQNKG
jgi:hypothetical protein